jgi:hypothetical protein
MVSPSSALRIFTHLNLAAVLELGANLEHVSFTLARASPEIGLLNMCRMVKNAAGSGEVVENGGKTHLQQRRRGRHLLLLLSLLLA